MPKPILAVFLISHYCEKARWALDYCGIDCEINNVLPGKHASYAKKLGAKRSAVPFLKTDDGVIQGSGEIIKWAVVNSHAALSENRPPLLINDESQALEARLDDILGVHIRRWFYSESLLDCPEIVKPVFLKDHSIIDKMTLMLIWPAVVKKMIVAMDLGPAQELQSKALVEVELDWLDGLLAHGGDYLLGDQLSNADIAAASLIAPLFEPEQHPISSVFSLPPRAAATALQWSDRPVARWLRAMYKKHR